MRARLCFPCGKRVPKALSSKVRKEKAQPEKSMGNAVYDNEAVWNSSYRDLTDILGMGGERLPQSFGSLRMLTNGFLHYPRIIFGGDGSAKAFDS